MKCSRVRDELIGCVEGDLPREKQAAIVQHLAGCRACQAEAAASRQAEEALRSLSAVVPAPELTGDLRRRLASASPAARSLRRLWAGAALAAAAAVAALLLLHPSTPAPRAIVANTTGARGQSPRGSLPVAGVRQSPDNSDLASGSVTPSPTLGRGPGGEVGAGRLAAAHQGSAASPQPFPQKVVVAHAAQRHDARRPTSPFRPSPARPDVQGVAQVRPAPSGEAAPGVARPVGAASDGRDSRLSTFDSRPSPVPDGVILLVGAPEPPSPPASYHFEVSFPDGSTSMREQTVDRTSAGDARIVQLTYRETQAAATVRNGG
jgi:anti-sigma factor RsiW